jgi:ABC-type branched-subunit amino acid transport system ATPase component
MTEAPVLRLIGIHKSFGGVRALSDVSLNVYPGQITGLVGPNGSGKTTLCNIASRFDYPDRGRVLLNGYDIGGLHPHQVIARGMARVFQTPQLCQGLTVAENLILGARFRGGSWRDLLWPPNGDCSVRLCGKAAETLEFLGLIAKSNVFPEQITYFEKRKLELGRALMSGARVLLLDEPTSGFTRNERDELAGILLELRRRSLAILLIEHDLDLVQRICDRVVVLSAGCKVAEGDPTLLRTNRTVSEIYLGVAPC